MEAQIQPRSNSRAFPTLDVRKVKIRNVDEAYENDSSNGKEFRIKPLHCVLLWTVFVICLFLVSLLTYPPSFWGLIAELALGVLISDCIVFLFFLKRNK